MNSEIILQFNSPLIGGDLLNISNGYSSFILPYSDVINVFEILISGNLNEDITRTLEYIQNRYNSTNIYTLTPNYTQHTLTITDNTGTFDFSVNENETDGRVTATINNVTPIVDIQITDLDITPNSIDPCNLYDITITTNIQATEVVEPIPQTVTTNPFTIVGVSRNDEVRSKVIVKDDNSTFNYGSILLPKLTIANFNLSIISALNGTSTLNIKFNDVNETTGDELILQYSLNNIDFYNSSSFSGLTVGSYTLYVKDNLNCTVNIPFEVTDTELNVYIREPVFRVSNQNSLITVNRDTKLSNITNTLSHEEEGCVNRKDFVQLFQKNDGILTQQFDTSYDNVNITLVDCQGNESIILTEQKTDNYDLTDVRDVTITTVNYLNQSYVAIQYVSGKTYDPVNLSENGSYYLASLVPEFMNTGDGIILDALGTFRVQDIVFKDNVQVLVLDILEYNFPISINNNIVKGTARYNQLNYNTFEYSLDLSALSGDYYIKYNALDSEFESVEKITEWFNVSEKQHRTYLVQYYNTDNNETNYSTGITNIIRIPYDIKLQYTPTDTQDIYNTDTNSVSLETTYRDSFILYTDNLPQGFLRKIGLAVSNNRVFINGLSVNKSENIEIEPIIGTNLYKATIQFIRSDYAYSSIASRNGSIVLPSGNALNINNNGSGFLLVN